MRIVIAGPEQSGKSCIIKRYCEKRFVAKYLPTVGIDYGATRIFVDKREVFLIKTTTPLHLTMLYRFLFTFSTLQEPLCSQT